MDAVLLSQTTSENVQASGKSRCLGHGVARPISGYDAACMNLFVRLRTTVRVTQRIK